MEITRGITSLSRSHDTIDIWWAMEDGSVQWAKYEEGGKWIQEEIAPAGSVENRCDLCALSVDTKRMDVWWLGKGGSVQGAHWKEGEQWKQYEITPPGSALALTAVSKFPGTIEVFWISPNLSINGSKRININENIWSNYPIFPENTAGHGVITAVSRLNGIIDLFWYKDSCIKRGICEDGEQWELYTAYAIPDYSESEINIEFAINNISAVSTNSWNITIFFSETTSRKIDIDENRPNQWPPRRTIVEKSRSINYAKWEEDEEWQIGLVEYDDPHSLSTLVPECITSLSRQQGSFEVWWINFYGRLVEGPGDNGTNRIKIAESAGFNGITSVSRYPGTVDLMWIGSDNSVKGARSNDGKYWDLYEITPPPPEPPPLEPIPVGNQRIDVTFEYIEERRGNLKITGKGFQRDEPIKIFVTLYENNEEISVERIDTRSNTITGFFEIQHEVQFSPEQSSIFTVIAQGRISGNSNSVNVSS